MKQVGCALRAIRLHRALTLHDVALIAEERGIAISPVWLASVEQEGTHLETEKLKLLAEIYALTPGQLVDSLFSQGVWPEAEETSLILPELSALSGPYRWGIIGKHDRSMSPQVPVGSAAIIDTREATIEAVTIRHTEPGRPIYFLRHGTTLYCGWCELHGKGLRLTPHPLSPMRMRTWGDNNEVTVVGRVIALIVPRTV
jgi:hypothetical protein